ncbi:peptidoglycan DD-metalloendopeptidase family protein [bacterium]|nr:peptidoglycan DD-metalloendopeptidase family protein [bacterium]
MPRKFSTLIKSGLVLGLFVFCSFTSDAFDSTEDDSLSAKYVNHHNFDRSLIPAMDIYGTQWDSLHIDSPWFEIAKLDTIFDLKLVEEDCEYVHPYKGPLNSKFGWRWNRMHKGMDIDLNMGDPIVAAFDGVVRIVKNDYYGFGNYVMIRHYNGIETLYAHLSRFNVLPNQTVRAGDVIGYGGNTGRSTGPHLHFETRFLGQAFDPSLIIDFDEFALKNKEISIDKTWFPYLVDPYKYQMQYAKYYRIRKGDTLSHIARRQGTTVTALCRLNGINRNTILRIGRTIRVR